MKRKFINNYLSIFSDPNDNNLSERSLEKMQHLMSCCYQTEIYKKFITGLDCGKSLAVSLIADKEREQGKQVVFIDAYKTIDSFKKFRTPFILDENISLILNKADVIVIDQIQLLTIFPSVLEILNKILLYKVSILVTAELTYNQIGKLPIPIVEKLRKFEHISLDN